MVQISIPTDDDGFISRDCPKCNQRFKVIVTDGNPETVAYCPYCAHQADEWWTQEQIDYATAAVEEKVILPELQEMADDFNRETGGSNLVNMRMRIKDDCSPGILPAETGEGMRIARFDCCDKRVKHAESADALYCIACGSSGKWHTE